MDKKIVVAAILERLRKEAQNLIAAAEETHRNATHEDNKAENKYDTRGLEASYLAEGQARKADEAELNLARFEALCPPPDFSKTDAIAPGALIELRLASQREWFFLAPGGGGLEIEIDGQECVVITPASPIGTALIGKRAGGSVALNGRPAEILTVL